MVEEAGKHYAFIVGNDHGVVEAKKMVDFFQKTLAYDDVKTLEDATDQEIIAKIREYRFLKKEDTLFFYYCGHGQVIKDQFHFATKQTLLPNSFLLIELSQIPSYSQLLFIDADYSGAFKTTSSNGKIVMCSAGESDKAIQESNFSRFFI